MNDIAIYTCITGGKDEVRKFPMEYSNCDAYLFTYDEDILNNPVNDRQVVKISRNSYSHNQNSQEVKHLSHKFLPSGYKYHVWTDGHIFFTTNPEQIINDCMNNANILSMRHPARYCIFDELHLSQQLGLVNKYEVEALETFLNEEGYPRHLGLAATGVIIRPVNDLTVEFNNLLWSTFSRAEFGPRDQLYFNYCVWKLGMSWSTIDYLDTKFMGYKHHKRG